MTGSMSKNARLSSGNILVAYYQCRGYSPDIHGVAHCCSRAISLDQPRAHCHFHKQTGGTLMEQNLTLPTSQIVLHTSYYEI